MRIRNAAWRTFNSYDHCSVSLDEADAQGLHGSATCTNLRWTDMFNQGFDGEGFVEGEPAFDAMIQFDAVATSSS